MKVSTIIIGYDDEILRVFNDYLYEPSMCIKIEGKFWYHWGIIDTVNEDSIKREIFLKR